ncbi:MAG: nucleotide exchange factor GrpE [Candidatus Cloacimonadota bacterium]|nr:nucleotide exchange factor GrpE [Candidatus Cloacimonadota bacterium]
MQEKKIEKNKQTVTKHRKAKIIKRKSRTPGLAQRNAKLKEEVEFYKDKWLRAVAEFENFRKRNIKERIDWIKNANQALLLEIIDVYEHLELAIKSAKDEKVPANYQKAIKMIYDQMKNILEKQGLKKMETVGKEFNPSLHDAVVCIEHKKYDENIIFDNVKNGYLLNDKVLCHARVAVSKGKKKNAK